jgi:hypothetical protein
LDIRGVSLRPHALRNDGAILADSVVDRPSVDGKGRTSILHGWICDKERVGWVLGDRRMKRSYVDTQKTCEVPRCTLWGERLSDVTINVEVHLQSSDVKVAGQHKKTRHIPSVSCELLLAEKRAALDHSTSLLSLANLCVMTLPSARFGPM